VLGIVIGVAAVIAMLAVGNGAQASITGSISASEQTCFSFLAAVQTALRRPRQRTQRKQ
jgi:ABC-type antimicrobial peptide transport system permease subunit